MGRQVVPALAAGWVLLLMLPPAGTGQTVHAAPAELSKAPLTALMPEGVPGPAQRPGWQEIRSEVHRANDGVRYALFVNPSYDGLYQITQYRIWARVEGQLHEESEKLFWNPEPGVRQPLHLFSREGEAWKRIPPGTPPYDREIMHAINLYNVHRQSLGAGAF
jgi:hypothetical protein